jgi:hypothetical protein
MPMAALNHSRVFIEEADRDHRRLADHLREPCEIVEFCLRGRVEDIVPV